jgi:hypothetical protein
MNVNITGMYENTIFEDLQLLQTDLSSLVNVVDGLPLQYADLTSFTILSNDYTAYKENSISYITNINNDIVNLSTNISILNTDINYNYVSITALSTLSTAVDDQFTLTQLILMTR